MKVLIINGYAGSLTIAASQEGCEIVGAYEDAAYGQPIQRANFPSIEYVPRHPWPDRDLSDTVIIAHPPCTPFSQQSTIRDLRGTKHPAWQRTLDIFAHALKHRALAVVTESVTGTCVGARYVHEAYAKEAGYNLFRLIQNTCTFGVPQVRERFWAVFTRTATLPLDYEPEYVALREAFSKLETYTPQPGFTARFNRQMQMLEDRKLPAERMIRGEYGYGSLSRILARYFGTPEPRHSQYRKEYCISGGFSTGICGVLDPDRMCRTLLSHSFRIYDGRPLSVEMAKTVMGYPVSYKMPTEETQAYLSRGVVPAVARFVLRGVRNAVEGRPGNSTVFPGETLDLRVDRGPFQC